MEPIPHAAREVGWPAPFWPGQHPPQKVAPPWWRRYERRKVSIDDWEYKRVPPSASRPRPEPWYSRRQASDDFFNAEHEKGLCHARTHHVCQELTVILELERHALQIYQWMMGEAWRRREALEKEFPEEFANTDDDDLD